MDDSRTGLVRVGTALKLMLAFATKRGGDKAVVKTVIANLKAKYPAKTIVSPNSQIQADVIAAWWAIRTATHYQEESTKYSFRAKNPAMMRLAKAAAAIDREIKKDGQESQEPDLFNPPREQRQHNCYYCARRFCPGYSWENETGCQNWR